MNKISIIRVKSGKNSTLSHLYLNGLFLCYLLEDRISKIKEAGLTCIPEGNYQLALNTTAGMNKTYKNRFPAFHKGMIQITGIKDFDLVFIHIGNYHSQTKGCPLAGHYWQKVNGDYEVLQSGFSYLVVYPQLVKAMQEGIASFTIINQVQDERNIAA